MRIWLLVLKEILHRKQSFILSLLSIAIATGTLVGAYALLDQHDLQTARILSDMEAAVTEQMADLQDDMRETMLKLGFNIIILPENQNLGDWYADDYASQYMPEQYVDRLAESGIVTVRHFLPILQQKIKWPEKKRTILLVGTREEVPNLNKNVRKPLVQPIPPGKIVLGYELHESLSLEPGDLVSLLGMEFIVHKCHAERGNKDDITSWIHLSDAQELLDKPGQINAILALQCMCAGSEISLLRNEIARILPETQLIEIAGNVLVRAEARTRVAEQAKASLESERQVRGRLRQERQRSASIIVAVVMTASAIWIAFLALVNVRSRRYEIAVFRALGFRSAKILMLFLSKAFATGLVGGVVGFYLGSFFGTLMANGQADIASVSFNYVLFIEALLLAVCLTTLASWLPAIVAARQDPALILSQE